MTPPRALRCGSAAFAAWNDRFGSMSTTAPNPFGRKLLREADEVAGHVVHHDVEAPTQVRGPCDRQLDRGRIAHFGWDRRRPYAAVAGFIGRR